MYNRHMNVDNVMAALYKSKKSVQKEISDMAAWTQGWNAAIDHVLDVLKRMR